MGGEGIMEIPNREVGVSAPRGAPKKGCTVKVGQLKNNFDTSADVFLKQAALLQDIQEKAEAVRTLFLETPSELL